jgi:hypothetical protein
MATKKTTKPKASAYTKQIATRMDVVSFARLLATSLGNDRWFTEDLIKSTFKQSGPAGTVKKDTSKATKIPNLESDNKVMDSLLSIHDLLKKNYDDKLKSDEKKNQFRVEQSIERKKQNDDFINALGGIGGSTTTVVNNNTATKVKDDSDMGLLGELLESGKMLIDIAKFFMATPLGLGLLLGLSAMYMLYKDKNAEATTKGILNAGDISSGGTSIQEARSDEVNSRKAVVLREAHKKGIIKASWYEFAKQGKEENEYLKSIGFDDKTGLTQKDRDNGFNAVDEDGNPYLSKSRAKEMAKATSTDVVATPMAESAASAPASSSSSPVASAPASPSRSPAASAPASSSSSPVASAPASPSSSPAASAPASSSSSPVASAPASPSSSPAASVPAESSLSPSESVISEPATVPAQMSSPNITQKLDVVNNENLEMKLPQEPSDKGMMITNNEKTKGQKGSTKVALPSVRNSEETFQRMILNSTRVV